MADLAPSAAFKARATARRRHLAAANILAGNSKAVPELMKYFGVNIVSTEYSDRRTFGAKFPAGECHRREIYGTDITNTELR